MSNKQLYVPISVIFIIDIEDKSDVVDKER